MGQDKARSAGRVSFIWVGLMLACGLAALGVFSASRDATRRFDAFALEPPLDGWNGSARVNILLLGIDERENQAGPWRTDTLIVLSVDPAARRAALLSLPRDLWITIPGLNQPGKINTAHFLGDAEGYPGGGPALAMAAVEATLGLRVPYYIRLNFSAFENLIDLIGGIDVDVPQPIDDPLYPDSGFGYEPLFIPAGRQHLDGRLALKYARTRHAAMGDFDRMVRQQQVLRAVRDRVLQAGLLPQLVAQAGPLLHNLGDSLKTNLTLDQLIRLAQLGAELSPADIQSWTVEPTMTTALHIDSNPPQDALQLRPEALALLRARLLDAAVTPVVTAAPALNTATGTPRTAGLYEVQPGDTLSAIAARFGVTLEALMAANNLSGYDIYPGQSLVIP
jgi:LCP family protein required for cell wall assembly